MLGSLVNAGLVVLGGLIGLLLSRSIPERLKNIVLHAVGLSTLALGVAMTVRMSDPVILVLGMLAGGVVGEVLGVEEALEVLGDTVKAKLKGGGRFSEGLATSFITFCIGPMTVIGSIEDGLGDPSIILAKSVLDFFMAITYSSIMGSGVIFSAIPLLAYQGSIAVLASYVSPALSPQILDNLTAAGGVLLLGLALRILEIKNIKTANLLPGLFLVPLAAALTGS